MQNFYVKICSVPTSRLEIGSVFDAELLENNDGIIVIKFTGKGTYQLFGNEAGGHRWQRVSPTEKRGRVHTSTVTVAVLNPEDCSTFKLDERDVDIKTSRGSGPGGQHRNKTDSCVTATHIPTGVSVRIDMKSQHKSKEMALKILASKIGKSQANAERQHRDKLRKEQVGTGQRGDKIRTYRQQDDQVNDHVTGKTWTLKKWMRGDW
jgi:peptide chain release factor 1